jgi:hypothetical protein
MLFFGWCVLYDPVVLPNAATINVPKAYRLQYHPSTCPPMEKCHQCISEHGVSLVCRSSYPHRVNAHDIAAESPNVRYMGHGYGEQQDTEKEKAISASRNSTVSVQYGGHEKKAQ